MPIVEITPEEDSQLEQVVPDWLKGEKNARKRVRWGLGRLFELLQPRQSQPESEPATSRQG
jgi:hypothetical protein